MRGPAVLWRWPGEAEEAKETFLAILGHDLRTPLGAIHTSAGFPLEAGRLEHVERSLVTRVAASAERSVTMVGDPLEFTRGHLGGGIPVVRAELDLTRAVGDAVDEIRAAHPDCPIRVNASGEHWGSGDAARLSQALCNLIGDGVQHGAEGATVTVDVRGTAEPISVAVHNRGAVMSPEQLDGVFNPMRVRRRRSATAHGPNGCLGLGLYIAEQIIRAHNGHLDVQSSEKAGTTFTVDLPR